MPGMELFKLVGLALCLVAAGIGYARDAAAQHPPPQGSGNPLPPSLSAIGDDGAAVDWWLIYKFPKNIAPSAGVNALKSQGDEYL